MKKNMLLLSFMFIFTLSYGQGDYVPKTNSNFCSTIEEIIEHSYSDFSNIKGAEISVEGDVIKTFKYEPGIYLQNCEDCYIELFMGSWSYRAILQTSSQKSKVIEKCDEVMNTLINCFGNSIYYEKHHEDDGLINYSVGEKTLEYYSSSIIYIICYQKKNNDFEAYISIRKPTAEKIFSIPYSSGSSDYTFDNNLKKQLSNAYNTFKNILGEKHIEESTWSTNIYYDVNAKLPGSESCIYDETGSFIAHPCESLFYEGDDKFFAVGFYKELEQSIKEALGSDYVYRVCEIYKNDPKGKMIFVKESEIDNETGLVILESTEISGTYYVTIEVLFDSFLSPMF